MNDVLTLSLPFFGLIFLGFAIGKFVRIPENGFYGLNLLIIYLALPALFFQLISRTPIADLGSWGFIAGSTLSTLAIFTVAFVVGTILTRGNIAEAGIQGLAASYGNIGYMAPGLTLGTFGDAASVPTALVFCFDNALMFTLAPLVMAVAGAGESSPLRVAGVVVRRVLTHPFIIATILGVAAAAVKFVPPAPVDRLLTLLSNAAAPSALFALGVSIALRPITRLPFELPVVILLKLLAHPALVYVVLSWVGDFSPVWVYTAVLMAALPTASNVFVLAQQYGVWVNRASATVLVSTIIAIVTVTGLLYLITSGTLPPDLFPSAAPDLFPSAAPGVSPP